MTLVDHTMLNGSIGFFALGAGVFALMILVALKADGRGFSMTKINNEIEMEKIQKEPEKREAEQKAKEKNADRDGAFRPAAAQVRARRTPEVLRIPQRSRQR